MLNPLPGIYAIINNDTNTYYIGQSINMYDRIRHHISDLNRKVHSNSDLQIAWNIKKETTFKIISLYEITNVDDYSITKLKSLLLEKETEYITLYNTTAHVYNQVLTPNVSCWPHGETTRIRMSKAHSGAKNHEALLTEEQVICLLTDDSILSYKEAKTKYGVSRACIKDIWQRRSWQHLKYPKVIKEDEPAKRSGENHPFGQLKEVEAIAILTTDAGLTVRECAEKYHTTRIVIEQLRSRNTWKHLDLPAVYTKDSHKATGTTNGNSKLTEKDVKEIKLALSEGRSCCSIGKEYKVSNVAIANIRDGKVWKDI